MQIYKKVDILNSDINFSPKNRNKIVENGAIRHSENKYVM